MTPQPLGFARTFLHSLFAVIITLALGGELGCGVPPDGEDDASLIGQAAVAAPRTIFLNFSGATCGYGGLDECKKKLQGILDGWYAHFNVVFTHTLPASGTFYKVDVAFNGSAGGGQSQLSCDDQFGKPIICRAQVGGSRALISNAGTVAHEHGHSVGLHHSDGPTDIMNQRADNDSMGFEDKDNNLLDNTHCRDKQNSYRLMLARLGAWPGGCKSGPYGEFCPDGMGAAGVGGGSSISGGNSGSGGSSISGGNSGSGGPIGSGGVASGGSNGSKGAGGNGGTPEEKPRSGGDGGPMGAATGGVGAANDLPKDQEGDDGNSSNGGCSLSPYRGPSPFPLVFSLGLFSVVLTRNRQRRRRKGFLFTPQHQRSAASASRALFACDLKK